jgi:hypothetical protein
MMRQILTILAALLVPVVAQAADLVPHRAVYDMGFLKRAHDTPYAQVDGRMVYHYDRTCHGATYNHRMLLVLVSKQGQEIRSETFLSFFETADGHSMQFEIRELLNESPIVHLQGTVKRSSVGQPGTVTYEKRDGIEAEKLAEVPAGALFPMQHTDALISAAIEGSVIHNASTFDGDEVSLVDSFIQPSTDPGREAAVVPKGMAGMKSWISRISFFKPDAEEPVPFYETQMRFWENGLSGDFTMESEDFGVLAKLKEVELFERPDCG